MIAIGLKQIDSGNSDSLHLDLYTVSGVVSLASYLFFPQIIGYGGSIRTVSGVCSLIIYIYALLHPWQHVVSVFGSVGTSVDSECDTVEQNNVYVRFHET